MASASLDVCVVASFAIPNGFDCTGVFLTCLILSAKFHDIFELAKSVFAAGMRSFLRLWSRALAWARDDLAKEFTEADLPTSLAGTLLFFCPSFPLICSRSFLLASGCTIICRKEAYASPNF